VRVVLRRPPTGPSRASSTGPGSTAIATRASASSWCGPKCSVARSALGSQPGGDALAQGARLATAGPGRQSHPEAAPAGSGADTLLRHRPAVCWRRWL